MLTTLNEKGKSNLKEWIESALKVIIEKKGIEEIRKQLVESKIENHKKLKSFRKIKFRRNEKIIFQIFFWNLCFGSDFFSKKF